MATAPALLYVLRVCVAWLLGAALAAAQVEAQERSAPLRLVRVVTDAAPALQAELAGAGFDVLHGPPDRDAVRLVVTAAEHRALVSRGLAVELLEVGRPFAHIQTETETETGPAPAADGVVPGGYLDRPGIEAALGALAAAHPTRAELVDLTLRYDQPPTARGNHLFALRISDDVSVEQDEPALLVVAAYHAREVVTPVLALDTAERLLAGYGTDATLTALIDAHEIWIAPLWNPDGYDHVFAVDNLWRKNRRTFGAAGIGVDLNRNADFEWDSICSGGTLPSDSTYKGPTPGSEVETATMTAFATDRHFARVLDLHSPGREVLYAYACASHPLVDFLRGEAVTLSAVAGYLGDTRLPSAEGEHFEWQLARRGAFAFLLETATTFQPSHAAALAEATLVWPGTLWWLQRPMSLSGHVRDACSQSPLDARVTVAGLAYGAGELHPSGGPFGRYHLFLPPGSYSLEFTAPGHVTAVHPLTVTATSAAVLDVALEPLAPVTGCWTDLGHALAGTHGPPRLTGSGTLVGGTPTTLALDGALGNTTTWLVVGIARGDLAPFYGGTLVPDITPPGFFTPLPTDAAGGFVFSAPWPPGLPPGFELYFQHWVVDPAGPFGFAASNALEAVTP